MHPTGMKFTATLKTSQGLHKSVETQMKTAISIDINLDGSGKSNIQHRKLASFDHLLTQIAKQRKH